MQKEILQVIQNLYFKFIGLNYIVIKRVIVLFYEYETNFNLKNLLKHHIIKIL